MIFGLASAYIAYVLAVDCQTNEFCQDVHNSHMSCAHGNLACINNKCTCFIPNNHNIVCTAKDVCLAAPITQLNCTAELRHCVDGKCVCTSDI